METATATATASPTQPAPALRAFAWLAAFIIVWAVYSTAYGYGLESDFGAFITVVGGGVLVLSARQNWRTNWNWLGRFLRNSIGERNALMVFGFTGIAFAFGGLLGAMAR